MFIIREAYVACTWIKEEVADHLKTCHCSRGSAVPPVVCSLYRTLLRAGTSASVADNILKHMSENMNFIHCFTKLLILHITTFQ